MNTTRRTSVTREEILEKFTYNPDTGNFYDKETNKPVGKADRAGYVRMEVKGETYLVHRLAWVVLNNWWPDNFIDHINGNPSDNRAVNLRHASPSQNQYNRKLNANNTTGVKGVWWCAKIGKFKGSVRIKGKRLHIRGFGTLEEAACAIHRLRRATHGDFANNG